MTQENLADGATYSPMFKFQCWSTEILVLKICCEVCVPMPAQRLKLICMQLRPLILLASMAPLCGFGFKCA